MVPATWLYVGVVGIVMEQPLSADEVNPAGQADDTSSWVDLLANDLQDWIVEGKKSGAHIQPPDVWSIGADGVLRCDGRGFGFLRYRKKLDDFELQLEYKLDPGSNSGIGLRSCSYQSTPATRPSHAAYELQILDQDAVSLRGNMALYRHLAPLANPRLPAGEWNHVHIVCHGPRLLVRLNQKLVHDVNQAHHSKLRDKPLEGYLLLQNHHSVVEFRNLQLRAVASLSE